VIPQKTEKEIRREDNWIITEEPPATFPFFLQNEKCLLCEKKASYKLYLEGEHKKFLGWLCSLHATRTSFPTIKKRVRIALVEKYKKLINEYKEVLSLINREE